MIMSMSMAAFPLSYLFLSCFLYESTYLTVMEILLELFVTAFVAIIFSFLVTKLLSVDTAPKTNSRLNSSKTVEEESIVEEVKFNIGRLELQDTESESRFQYVVVGDHVNQLEGEGSFQKSPVSSCCKEFGQKSCQEERDDGEHGGEREREAKKLGMEEFIEDDEIINNEQSEEMVVGEYQSAEAHDDPLSEVENEYNQKGKENDGVVSENNNNDDGDDDDDDDDADDDEWEGIEKSELEKVFARALNYVAVKGLSSMKSDVQMQLYSLEKIAMCQEPQPKISLYAQWNGWRRMESMTPEAAMEQFIALLSAKDPTWMDGT